MCGIVGRVNLASGAPVEPSTLTMMCEALRHRGPDGGAIRVVGPVGLGHRRLAVIDLNPAANQPMVSQDGRFWITFNGEIYNYKSVRENLMARGHRFRTESDTEVLLAAYAEHGERCLEHLAGMFAFAIWDSLEERLFLARDRVGKKPLLYRLDDDGIVFASEMSAFAADPAASLAPSYSGLAAYLTFGYVPSDDSSFQGISKLPPAHYLTYSRRGVALQRYWKAQFSPKFVTSEQTAQAEVLARLRTAVRERLISDVPLGAFLSGGIDSSLIVALMAEQAGDQIRTFSIGFQEQSFDELAYARLVAERFRTRHTEFVVKPDATNILPVLASLYGEPFADASAIPTYYLAQLARANVTVALNGDGGDETFGGYSRYVIAPRARRYAKVPAAVRQIGARLVRGRRLPRRPSSYSTRVARWLTVMRGNPASRYCESVRALDSFVVSRLCTSEFVEATGVTRSDHFDRLYSECGGVDAPDGLMNVDLNTYLPGDILAKVDIATMAHGLEGRSPLLDHRLIEYAVRLPACYKVRGGTTKYLLKTIAAQFIPAELIDRPKKGFSVPLAQWFRAELRELLTDTLLSSTARARGIFRSDRVADLIKDHVDGSYDWHVPLYSMLMLELWFQAYIDRRPTPTRQPPRHPVMAVSP